MKYFKGCLSKYGKLPVEIKASIWFLICNSIQKAISVMTTPIFTRLLSAEEYGKYNIFMSWMSFILVIVSLNLFGGFYVSGLVKYEKVRKEFISSLHGLLIVLVLFWIVVYLCFVSFWNKLFGLNTIQMLAMFVLIWTQEVYNCWSAEQRIDCQYKKIVVITLIVSLMKPLLGIYLVTHFTDKVSARVLGLAFVEFICYAFLFVKQIINGKVLYSPKFWKKTLKINIPLIPHYLASAVLVNIDRIMIGQYVGDAEAGIYSLAYSLAMLPMLFSTALHQTLEPWINKKIFRKEVADISKVAYPSFVILTCINIGLIAFAPEVVKIFAPKEYYDAVWVIPPICVSVFFIFSYNMFSIFEFYFENNKVIICATCGGAVVNTILNYIFIPRYGYYAAGYSTLLSYILYAMFHYYFMRCICKRKLNNEQPYSSKVYFLIMIVFVMMSMIFLCSYKNVFIRYALISALVYILFSKRSTLLHFFREVLCVEKNN